LLTIDFQGTDDFLAKIGALVFALQNDYEAVSDFIEVAENPSGSSLREGPPGWPSQSHRIK